MNKNKINHIKSLSLYRFYCDIDPEEIDDIGDFFDEWGRAYVELGSIGTEYNFCLDRTSGTLLDCSAIYKDELIFDEDEKRSFLETNYDDCEHYSIDFNNPNWKEELENALVQALIEYFNL